MTKQEELEKNELIAKISQAMTSRVYPENSHSTKPWHKWVYGGAKNEQVGYV